MVDSLENLFSIKDVDNNGGVAKNAILIEVALPSSLKTMTEHELNKIYNT
jgi:hypothetical protein